MTRETKTVYLPLEDHIYNDGVSFRVRVVKEGKKISKNFRRAKEARKFRDSLLGV